MLALGCTGSLIWLRANHLKRLRSANTFGHLDQIASRASLGTMNTRLIRQLIDQLSCRAGFELSKTVKGRILRAELDFRSGKHVCRLPLSDGLNEFVTAITGPSLLYTNETEVRTFVSHLSRAVPSLIGANPDTIISPVARTFFALMMLRQKISYPVHLPHLDQRARHEAGENPTVEPSTRFHLTSTILSEAQHRSRTLINCVLSSACQTELLSAIWQ